MFKVFRLINILEKVKLVADPLIYSLSFLVNVTVFIIFMFLLYGIIGLQFFQGNQYSHCRVTEKPINATYWPLTPDFHDTCYRNSDCPELSFCGNPIQYGIRLENEKILERSLIQYGLSSFDNIFQSLMTVFQVITTDNWSQLMFNFMRASHQPFFAQIFFSIVVLSGAFFFVNLILAVILQAFTEVHQHKLQEDFKKKDLQLKKKRLQEELQIRHVRGFNGQLDDVFQRSFCEKIFHFCCPFQRRKFLGVRALNSYYSQTSNAINSSRFSKQSTIRNKKALQLNSQRSNPNRKESDRSIRSRAGSVSPQLKLPIPSVPLKRSFSIAKDSNALQMSFQQKFIEKQGKFPDSSPEKKNIQQMMKQVTRRMEELHSERGSGASRASARLQKNKSSSIFESSLGSQREENKEEESEENMESARSFDTEKSQKRKLKISDSLLELAFNSGLGTFQQKLLFIESQKKKINALMREQELETIKNRVESNKIAKILNDINNSLAFRALIYLTVFLSLVLTSFEETLSASTIYCAEVVFYFIFLLEALSKLAVQGIQIFLRDSHNCLDLVIILLTSFDLVLNYTHDIFQENEKLQILLSSAKILRVYKFLKLWDKMNNLVGIIFQIIKDIGQFSILLSIFVLGFSFLGMKLFAFKLEDDEDYHNVVASQTTFNSFIESLIAIMIVFANDGWSTILVNHYRVDHKAHTYLYFLALKLIGGYIILNLFLSILLENYENQSMNNRQNEPEEKKEGQLKKLQRYLKKAKRKILKFLRRKNKVQNVEEKESQESIFEETISQRRKRRASKRFQEARNKRLSSKTMGFFTRNSLFRLKVIQFVKSKKFQLVIIATILLSSLQLALEDPLTSKQNAKYWTLFIADILFTIVFMFEALLKIIATGFYWNGPRSYLKSSWNKLDFSIVLFSLTSFLPLSVLDFSAVKVLRLIRILRPLRMLSKSENLKIAIASLLNSFPSMLDVLAVTFISQIFFAGTSFRLLRGKMASCSGFLEEILDTIPLREANKWVCLNAGGQWKNQLTHFDSFSYSFMTVGHMSTTAGWAEVMYQAVSENGKDNFHIPMNNPLKALLFVLIIVFCNFFLFNFFIGVVISSFNHQKEQLSKDFMLMENQRQWLQIKLLVLKQNPIKRISRPTFSDFRGKVYDFCISDIFENFMLFLIILNTLSMSIRWYDWEHDRTEEKVNNIFLLFFVVEAVLKITAFGLKYFSSNWNIFDFIVVLAGMISYAVSIYAVSLSLGPSATFFRSIKLFRLIKLIKQNKALQVVFQTLIQTLPQLLNAGLFLLLFLYIYSILGMNLFAQVKLSYPLNDYINFQSFLPSLLLLFRVATGENWQQVVKALGREKDLDFACIVEPDYQDYLENGKEPIGCGSKLSSIVFFFTFLFLVSLIFLNLFIAIVIQQFQYATMQSKKCFTPDMADHFKEVWSFFDPEATGLIPMRKFEKFMIQLEMPLGWSLEEALNKEFQVEYVTQKMELNIYKNLEENCYSFFEVLESLAMIIVIKSEIIESNDMQKMRKAATMEGENRVMFEVEYELQDFVDLKKKLRQGEFNDESNTAKNVGKLQLNKQATLKKTFANYKVFKDRKAKVIMENSIKKSKLAIQIDDAVSERESFQSNSQLNLLKIKNQNQMKNGKFSSSFLLPSMSKSVYKPNQHSSQLDKFMRKNSSQRRKSENLTLNGKENESSSSSNVEELKQEKIAENKNRIQLNKQISIGVESLEESPFQRNYSFMEAQQNQLLKIEEGKNFQMKSKNGFSYQKGLFVKKQTFLHRITSQSNSNSSSQESKKQISSLSSDVKQDNIIELKDEKVKVGLCNQKEIIQKQSKIIQIEDLQPVKQSKSVQKNSKVQIQNKSKLIRQQTSFKNYERERSDSKKTVSEPYLGLLIKQATKEYRESSHQESSHQSAFQKNSSKKSNFVQVQSLKKETGENQSKGKQNQLFFPRELNSSIKEEAESEDFNQEVTEIFKGKQKKQKLKSETLTRKKKSDPKEQNNSNKKEEESFKMGSQSNQDSVYIEKPKLQEFKLPQLRELEKPKEQVDPQNIPQRNFWSSQLTPEERKKREDYWNAMKAFNIRSESDESSVPSDNNERVFDNAKILKFLQDRLDQQKDEKLSNLTIKMQFK